MIYQKTKTNPYYWLILVFLILCSINLSAEFFHQRWLIYLSKPLLVSILSIYFYLNAPNNFFSRYLLLGFIFSVGGDTLLMFNENASGGQLFFIFGLSSFLVAHLMYLIAFMIFPEREKGILYQKPWLFLFFLFYLIGNILFLWPHLPKVIDIAVVIYCICIIGMATAAFNLWNRVERSILIWLLLGVILFVISDSLIALNKFTPFAAYIPLPRLSIMITYLASQLLICLTGIQLAKYI